MRGVPRLLQWRYARRRFWRRQKESFAAIGLTTRGTKPIYERHPELKKRGVTEKWKRMMRQRKSRARRSIAKCNFTPVEKIYREWREQNII